MKYRVGEFVRFVEEKREGYITRIIDDLTVAVTDNDGFEIPVPASQVTRIHGQAPETEDIHVVQHDPSKEFKKSGLYLALLNDKNNAAVAHFHILNQSSYHVLTTLTTSVAERFRNEFSGTVGPESHFKIFSASLSEVDRWPKFHIQVLFYTAESDELKQPLAFERKFQGRDLSVQKLPLMINDEKGWLFRLDEEPGVIDIVKLKDRFNSR